MSEFVIDGYRRASLIRRDVAITAQPLNERADYAHGQRFLHDGPILRLSAATDHMRLAEKLAVATNGAAQAPPRTLQGSCKPSAAACVQTGLTTGRLNCLRQQRSF